MNAPRMVMHLDHVVPFGRSLDEYIQMFSLSTNDLQQTILGVGDGPASFNAEGTARGCRITSIDPLYCFTADQIEERFIKVVDHIIEQVVNTPHDWVWSYHASPASLKAHREQVLHRFITDFPTGKKAGRYIVGELPTLNYPDQAFDLGLCSHLLFLYSDHLDQQFHATAIREMLRVSREVRIFPLLNLLLETSPHLTPIMQQLQDLGFTCTIQPVNYELQRGGNQMLQITRTLQQ